jgi:dTDP-4-dehydrorhamnose 3,5-epimerase
MEIIETGLVGLYLVKQKVFEDHRGSFIKTYNKDQFFDLGIELEIRERYFSISHKNVIRGMHFQIPPYDHVKLVSVMQGSIFDVVLDLRKNSQTYGEYFHIILNAKDGVAIYIPKGFAHGFLALENNSLIEYNQSTVYNQSSDTGIRYDSFGIDWGIASPIMSSRDLNFIEFKKFNTPF